MTGFIEQQMQQPTTLTRTRLKTPRAAAILKIRHYLVETDGHKYGTPLLQCGSYGRKRPDLELRYGPMS
jgi:hypothetical protein